MRLGDHLVAVDERDLEVGEVVVEPAPVLATRFVVMHELGERHP
jgi:hypothetical protein